MDQPGPDAPQLDPQEQQQPEASYPMQSDDEPILRAATHQADKDGRDGEAGRERKAPVGEARGKKSASLCSTVSFHLFMHSIPRGPRSTSNSPVPKYIITRTIVHFDKLIRPSVGASAKRSGARITTPCPQPIMSFKHIPRIPVGADLSRTPPIYQPSCWLFQYPA